MSDHVFKQKIGHFGLSIIKRTYATWDGEYSGYESAIIDNSADKSKMPFGLRFLREGDFCSEFSKFNSPEDVEKFLKQHEG